MTPIDLSTKPGQPQIEDALAQPERWRRWRDNGIEAVSRHFSWDAHVSHYLGEALAGCHQAARQRPVRWFQQPQPCQVGSAEPAFKRQSQRLLVLNLDASLASPDPAALAVLRRRLGAEPDLAIGVMSGRGFRAARHRFGELHLPAPLLWITEAGTEIHYSDPKGDWLDENWRRQIALHWDRSAVEAAMAELEPRLKRQQETDQGEFKVSYLLTEPDQGILPVVRQTLRSHQLMARPHLFHHWFLDVLPLTASKTEALRYLALRWQIPIGAILVEANQQGDGELLRGLSLGVVSQDHDPVLEGFRHHRRVFFSTQPQAWGLLDGLDHHRFLRRPTGAEPMAAQ